MSGLPAPRGRHRLPGPVGRRGRRRARRGGLHDRDVRLPGDRRPTRASRSSSSASRRRWSGTTASRRRAASRTAPHARGGPHAAGAGARPGPTWLAEQRRRRPRRASTRARSCSTCASAARCAPPLVAGEASHREVLERVRAQPPMDGRAPRRRRLHARSTRVGGRRDRASRSLDYGCKRSIVSRLLAAGASVTRLPAPTPTRTTCSRARRTASSSRTARAIRRRSTGEVAHGRATCSAGCRCSGSASATSCSRGGRATRRSSSVRPPRREPPGARGRDGPRARHRPEPRLRRPRPRENGPVVTHVSLYDGTVEGLALPRRRARARCSSIPRRARARTTRGRSSRRWVEELRHAAGGLTSTRSA